MSNSKQETVTRPKLPIETLDEFLVEATGLIGNIVGPWNQLLFEEEDRGPILDAWQELIDKLTPETGSQEISCISMNEYSDIQINDAGLLGKQLRVKLKGLNAAWKAFRERGSIGRLKTLLGWINPILGSMVSVFPAAEGLKEFLEFVDKFISKSEA